MNYDRIILELLGRVQVLEDEIKEIKKLYSSDDDFYVEDDEEKEKFDYTRTEARGIAIKALQDQFPEYVFRKGKRVEGNGIVVIKDDIKNPVIVKFFHSKTYKEQHGSMEHSWFTVKIDDIMGSYIDLCLFSMVDSNDEWHYFIFEPHELCIFQENHRSSYGDLLHLYFAVEDGKASDIREDTVDITDRLNNWEKLRSYKSDSE